MKIELPIKLFEGWINGKTLKHVYITNLYKKKKSEQLNNLHK